MNIEKHKEKTLRLVEAGDAVALAKFLRRHPASEETLKDALTAAFSGTRVDPGTVKALVDAGAPVEELVEHTPAIVAADPSLLEWLLTVLPDDGSCGEAAYRAVFYSDSELVWRIVSKLVNFRTPCSSESLFALRLLASRYSTRAVKVARMMLVEGDEIDFNGADGKEPLSFALLRAMHNGARSDAWSIGRPAPHTLTLLPDGLVEVFKAFETRIDYSVEWKGRDLTDEALLCIPLSAGKCADFIASRAIKARPRPAEGRESWELALSLVRRNCTEALGALASSVVLEDALGRPFWRVLMGGSLRVGGTSCGPHMFATLKEAGLLPGRDELALWMFGDGGLTALLESCSPKAVCFTEVARHISEGAVSDKAASLAASALALCGELDPSLELPWLLKAIAAGAAPATPAPEANAESEAEANAEANAG